jgi:hypothetical protein
MRRLLATLMLVLMTMPAPARDPDGRYANAPHRDWYQSRKLTPAANARFGFWSCCDHSDVVRTRFRPTKEGGDGWEFVDASGMWARVPDDIIHWGESTPTGEPVLFAVNDKPVCFFPGDGGI